MEEIGRKETFTPQALRKARGNMLPLLLPSVFEVSDDGARSSDQFPLFTKRVALQFVAKSFSTVITTANYYIHYYIRYYIRDSRKVNFGSVDFMNYYRTLRVNVIYQYRELLVNYNICEEIGQIGFEQIEKCNVNSNNIDMYIIVI